MKKTLIILIAIVIIGAGVIYIAENSVSNTLTSSDYFDAKNSSFTLDGQLIVLKHGVSETSTTPGSDTEITTKYFGNDVSGDLNNDGVDDTAFLVTQASSGSGTFYYAVVALKTPIGYKTTNAFFIGDRIAPQYNEIHSSELHINFAQRKPDEPMSVQPSVGAVLLLKVTPEGILEGLMK